MIRALAVANASGESARPIHFLTVLAEGDGPIASALSKIDRGRTVARETAPWSGRRWGSSYLLRQTYGAARDFLDARGGLARSEGYLLVALIDQGDEEVDAAINSAGLDITALRVLALNLLGAPDDLPPIAMPRLTPAGTADRPALPLGDLDKTAWAQLQARQDRLPLRRLRSADQVGSLRHLEDRATLKITDKLELDDDERYSLLHYHRAQIEQRVALKPDLVPARSFEPSAGRVAVARYSRGPRSRRRRGFRFTVGWGTWFSNRRVALRDRWFWLRTLPDYRRAPQK